MLRYLPLVKEKTGHLKNKTIRGADIAQWIRLRLPSCHTGFESQAHHLCFFQFILFKLYIFHLNWNVKRWKINKKEAGIGPFFTKTSKTSQYFSLTRRLMMKQQIQIKNRST